MLNIADRMRELIVNLQGGFNGISFPEVKPEGEEYWSPHSATLQHVYWDDVDLPPGAEDYFDWAQFCYDFEMHLKAFFEIAGGDSVVLVRSHEKRTDCEVIEAQQVRPFIMVRFNERSQELEVYRLPTDFTR